MAFTRIALAMTATGLAVIVGSFQMHRSPPPMEVGLIDTVVTETTKPAITIAIAVVVPARPSRAKPRWLADTCSKT